MLENNSLFAADIKCMFKICC